MTRADADRSLPGQSERNPAGSNGFTLPPGEVQVWRVALAVSEPRCRQLSELLDGPERERAARYYFPRDRRRFTVARAGLRLLLGAYCGVAPALIRFSQNAYGKPALEGADPPLDFNLSHSGEMALYAVARQAELGIDVEQHRPDIALLDLARRFFAPSEAAALVALPAPARAAAFYRCWTRKEALIKALGLGLAMPLDAFTVSLQPEASLLDLRGHPGAAAEWLLRNVPVPEGYTGALAVRGPGWRVRVQDWDPDRAARPGMTATTHPVSSAQQ
ncbi:MAG: 4'-phosphopantetheinyl transferase superfamily protein [Alphaproteobacteria bacterium]|nr:4'-phosphopantetheinyl transferase superfamily protein [Alphaproteobacteria bacterium]